METDKHLTVRQRLEDEYFKKLIFERLDPVKDIIDADLKNMAMTLIGRRRSGKSFFIRDLFYKIGHHYESVYLFSGTIEVQQDFWDFIHPDNIFHGIDENALNKIWQKQTKMILSNPGVDKSTLPHVLIIFDDIIQSNTGARNSDFICKMYSNGRHYNCASILATQSLKKISKHARDNTDITVAYNFKNAEDTNDFVDENFTVDSNRLGRKIFNSITGKENHEAIVVLNYLSTNNIEKSIKSYIANPKIPKVKDKKRIVKIKSDIPSLYSIETKVGGQSRYRFEDN